MEKELTLAEEYNQQGKILSAKSKFAEAMIALQKAKEIDPMCMETYLNMALVHISLEEFDEAREELNKILLVHKNSGEVYFHLGNVAYIQGNIDEARSHYTKSINMGYENTRVMYHLASLYLESGDVQNAKFYFGKMLKEDPYNIVARLRIIEILVAQEHYEEALRNADLLMEYRPDTFEGYHYRFITLLGLGRFEESKKTLDQAIELFPGDLGFAYDLVKYYEHIEDYQAALEVIDNRFAQEEENWNNIRKEKAKILFTIQDFDGAKKLFIDILKEEHDDEICFSLMILYGGYAQYEDALKCCEQIVDQKGENQYYFSAIYHQAVCYKKLERNDMANIKYGEAQKTFRSACSKYPGNLVLYLYRALCYREKKETERAFEMLEYIITLSDGTLAEAYYVRSQLYDDLGEHSRAKEDKDKAMTLNKTLKDILM